MKSSTRPRCATTALTALALLALVPATGEAALVRFGSDLKAPANVVEARPADTAYWQTAFAGGQKRTAPARGQVRSIKIKGIALSNPKAGVPGGETMFHLQALRKRPDGTLKILRTSGAFFLPPKGTDPQRITTYRPVNFCIAKGDVLAFNTVGGWDTTADGPYSKGTPLQIFSAVAGSNVAEFFGPDKTNNGDIVKPKTAPGRGHELLMQATIGTGSDGTALCPGGKRR